MKRILIIGNCGCGKSTLAQQLAAKLDLPLHHLDRLFWQPGWVESDREEFDRRLAVILAQESWIIDGNYLRTLPERLRFADTVIWLDYPVPVALWRAVKRIICWNGRVRPDMPEGCPERWDWGFLRYISGFKRKMQPKTEAVLAGFTGKVFRFTSPRQCRKFMISPVNDEVMK